MTEIIAEQDIPVDEFTTNAESHCAHYANSSGETGMLAEKLAEAVHIIKRQKQEIVELKELIYVYENTPFAHWRDRAVMAEQEIVELRERLAKAKKALGQILDYGDRTWKEQVARGALKEAEK